MKVWKVIAKIVVALAAIAGIVYVVATYGDRIVAWARKLLNRGACCECDCECDCDECDCEEDCDNCPCECACDCECEEAEAEEAEAVEEAAEADENAVVAEQKDFEG